VAMQLFQAMEHKGIPYTVVQTANPTGFRWAVEFDENKTKMGVSYSRGDAVFQAIRVIDKASKAPPKPK
jgi:hypothetical protein